MWNLVQVDFKLLTQAGKQKFILQQQQNFKKN